MKVMFDQKAIDRFMDKISPEPNSGCWLWIGVVNIRGYGDFSLKNKGMRAHRFSYELAHGPIPDGLQIDHLCRVRSCVNPDHLEAVTQQENIRRGDAGKHQRDKTHCPQGHPYSGDNLVMEGKRTNRKCRTCKNERHRVFRAKKRIHEKAKDSAA